MVEMRTVTCFLLVIAMFADVSQQYTTYSVNQQQRTTTITPQQPSACRNGWVSLAGSCYFFGSEGVTWPRALWMCQENGGYLAEINSLEENDAIVAQIRKKQGFFFNFGVSYWIGATDAFSEGHWRWLSSDRSIGPYTNWSPHQPDNHGSLEDCLELRYAYEYKWNDVPCTFENWFVCESSTLKEC